MDNDGPQNEIVMNKIDASKKHRRLLPARQEDGNHFAVR